MPATTANPAAWFDTARRAMQQLRDRRRRAWTGESATAATRSSTPTPPGGGGGGPGGGGGGGGTGPTGSTGTSTGTIPYTIAEQLTAGGAGAAAGSAASVAAVTAATATPHGMAPLSGLGAIVAQVRRNRRGFIDTNNALVFWCWLLLVLIGALGVNAAIDAAIDGMSAHADGSAARVTVAPDGFALAGWPDSLAIATGPTCGSIATQGRAFAAVPGATATAYSPAHAAGVPGSVLVLIGTRTDGSRVGVIVRPSTTPGIARPWHWYTLTNGALTSAGEVSPTDRQLITNAQQGTLP